MERLKLMKKLYPQYKPIPKKRRECINYLNINLIVRNNV